MFIIQKPSLAAAGALLLVTGFSVRSGTTASRATYVTFSGPVALPGVMLKPGTYVFELPSSTTGVHVVSVRDAATSRPCFVGLSQRIERPAGSVPPVMLGEGPPGVPPPIIAWYPRGESAGHKFIYRWPLKRLAVGCEP